MRELPEGVNIVIPSVSGAVGATTDGTGAFVVENVSVGKQTIVAAYIGYNTLAQPAVLVMSAKETVLQLMMEESAARIGEVNVRTQRLDEMTVISDRPP